MAEVMSACSVCGRVVLVTLIETDEYDYHVCEECLDYAEANCNEPVGHYVTGEPYYRCEDCHLVGDDCDCERESDWEDEDDDLFY